MPSAENRRNAPHAESERTSPVTRSRAALTRGFRLLRQRPLLTLVFLLGGMVILSSTASIVYYWASHRPDSRRYMTIGRALTLLDSGRYDEAKRVASRLQSKAGDDYHQLGHALFVQGAVLAHEAGQIAHREEREVLYLVAARYLEQAQERGFPPDRRKEGIYLLATSLFRSGRYAESLPALRQAFEQLPEQSHELARLLSKAYLKVRPPDWKLALRFNELWRKDPSLAPSERDAAYLQLSKITLGLQRPAACREALSQIAEDSPRHDAAMVIRAQVLIQEGDQLRGQSGQADASSDDAKAKYDKAIEVLTRAQSKDTTGQTTRRSRYLLGLCYEKLGDLRAAAKAYERARRLHYHTPEALAAGLAEAELAQQQGHYERALDIYLDVLEEAGEPQLYRNRWVPLSELRGRLLAAQHEFREAQRFPAALKLTEAFAPIVPEDEIAAAEAETREAWAKHLLETAAAKGGSAGDVTRAEARRQFRLAADRYRRLAELRFVTDEYPHDLWKSGHCFLRGQNYEQAREMLQKHLEHAPREQAPPGLVGLAECHLARANYHAALQVLSECIESFPKHPASYRARLLASVAYRETGKLDRAKALLIDNLHNSSLTPRSTYWQDSLFAYGKLLYHEAMIDHLESQKLFREANREQVEGEPQATEEAPPRNRNQALEKLSAAHDIFLEAIDSLGEAVARQPEARQAFQARYRVAQAYRHVAELPQRSLAIEPTQTRRNALREETQRYLRKSAQAHRSLQQDLRREQNARQLSRVERRLLRNTYFGYADALFELGEYDAAINAYVAATNHYQHRPEALEALLQIAACYRRLGATEEAQGTLLQAQAILSRIPEDAEFTKTTRYTREEWEQYVNWLAQL